MAPRLIIGYDPAHGTDSLALGGALARALKAAVIVATVFRSPPDLDDSDELQSALEAHSLAGFALARERLAGLEIETRAVAGRLAAEQLHRLAQDEDANLVVLGSSSRAEPGGLALGRLADSLLHEAPCAVTVAPRDYARIDHPRLLHLAAAFDGSAESWAALETVIGLAERSGGDVTVLTVAEPARYGYASAWSVLAAGEIRDPEREEKRRVLELAQHRVPRTLRGGARLLTGEPGSVLSEASEEFDLIVAGSRRRGPLRRAVLGSTTRELLQSGRCPVIVLPRAVALDPLRARAGEGGRGRRAATTA
jgi:nucleotide-binding universal stress UspA family protein